MKFKWNFIFWKDTSKIWSTSTFWLLVHTFAAVLFFAKFPFKFQHVSRKKSRYLKKRTVWSDPRRRTFSRVFKAQHPGSSTRLLPWCRAVQWWRQLRIRSSGRFRICSKSVTCDPRGVVCWYRQTLDGSFSAVSRPIFASTSKYFFFRNFRDLQDVHTFAPLQF